MLPSFYKYPVVEIIAMASVTISYTIKNRMGPKIRVQDYLKFYKEY